MGISHVCYNNLKNQNYSTVNVFLSIILCVKEVKCLSHIQQFGKRFHVVVLSYFRRCTVTQQEQW